MQTFRFLDQPLMKTRTFHALSLALLLNHSVPTRAAEPRSVSGIYPHLAMFSYE
jgi:hypothetical protein